MNWKDTIKKEEPDLPEGRAIAAEVAKYNGSDVGYLFYNKRGLPQLELPQGVFKPKDHKGNIQVWTNGDMDLHIWVAGEYGMSGSNAASLRQIQQNGKMVWSNPRSLQAGD